MSKVCAREIRPVSKTYELGIPRLEAGKEDDEDGESPSIRLERAPEALLLLEVVCPQKPLAIGTSTHCRPNFGK